jgi:hypothetical protein
MTRKARSYRRKRKDPESPESRKGVKKQTVLL